MSDIATESKAIIKNGSKSFSLASKFFNSELEDGAAQIYYWCRHCDDVIDNGEGSVDELLSKTLQVWDSSIEKLDPPFQALRNVTLKYNIPQTYPLDLLEGMRCDVEGRSYRTLKELELYCYYVASTVGLMMSHVMGVFDEKALKEASDLGKAMQLTNICRDVWEDYQRGRVYLPILNLRYRGIDSNFLFEDKTQLFEVMKEIIAESELLYKRGRSGIIHLPLRPALAVTIASLFYREIGREILRRGEKTIMERVVITNFQNLRLIIQGILEVCLSLPKRIMSNRKTVTIEGVWKPT